MTITRKLLSSIAVLGLIIAAGQAQAGCEDEAPFGQRSFTLCKVWPAYDDLTIVATSTVTPDFVDAGNDGGNVDLELLGRTVRWRIQKLKTTQVTLRYDGKQYVVPEALSG
ncbi:hypothetical protein [Pseudomonas sp. LB3P58]